MTNSIYSEIRSAEGKYVQEFIQRTRYLANASDPKVRGLVRCLVLSDNCLPIWLREWLLIKLFTNSNAVESSKIELALGNLYRRNISRVQHFDIDGEKCDMQIIQELDQQANVIAAANILLSIISDVEQLLAIIGFDSFKVHILASAQLENLKGRDFR